MLRENVKASATRGASNCTADHSIEGRAVVTPDESSEGVDTADLSVHTDNTEGDSNEEGSD